MLRNHSVVWEHSQSKTSSFWDHPIYLFNELHFLLFGLSICNMAEISPNFLAAYSHLSLLRDLPAEGRGVCLLHMDTNALPSLSPSTVTRRGRCQPDLLRSVRGAGRGDREVLWQRLRPGASCPFSSRCRARREGLWVLREADLKALEAAAWQELRPRQTKVR